MMTRFRVTNYKCLADVALDLTPLHVVIGQNDSGKTSLLEAMLALHRSTEGPLARAFPGRWEGIDLVYDGATVPVIEFEVSLSDESYYASKLDYRLSVRFSETGRDCRRVVETYGNERERWP